jgi:hypothetical protein
MKFNSEKKFEINRKCEGREASSPGIIAVFLGRIVAEIILSFLGKIVWLRSF